MTHPRLRLSLRRVAPQLDLASQLHGLRVRRHLELLAQVWKEDRREEEISFLALEIQRGNIAMNTPWKHGMKASKFDPEIAKRSDPKWNQRRDQRRIDRCNLCARGGGICPISHVVRPIPPSETGRGRKPPKDMIHNSLTE